MSLNLKLAASFKVISSIASSVGLNGFPVILCQIFEICGRVEHLFSSVGLLVFSVILDKPMKYAGEYNFFSLRIGTINKGSILTEEIYICKNFLRSKLTFFLIVGLCMENCILIRWIIVITGVFSKPCFFFDKPHKITTGFFSENTIVVAEGEMLLEGIFKVSISLSSHRTAKVYMILADDFITTTFSLWWCSL